VMTDMCLPLIKFDRVQNKASTLPVCITRSIDSSQLTTGYW
jgi:hypothetical protein